MITEQASSSPVRPTLFLKSIEKVREVKYVSPPVRTPSQSNISALSPSPITVTVLHIVTATTVITPQKGAESENFLSPVSNRRMLTTANSAAIYLKGVSPTGKNRYPKNAPIPQVKEYAEGTAAAKSTPRGVSTDNSLTRELSKATAARATCTATDFAASGKLKS